MPRATAALASVIESKLIEEVGGPVGAVVAQPLGGDSLTALQADIQKLRGRLVMVESTSGGYGDAASAPRTDWIPRRVGANPPPPLIELRERASAGILAAAGCPLSLLSRSDGVLAREELRRAVSFTFEPVARVVASELGAKLDVPGLAFDFSALFASDLQGRSRAMKALVQSGLPLADAVSLTGLLVADDE